MSPEIAPKKTTPRARGFAVLCTLLMGGMFVGTGYGVSKFIETKTRTVVERAVPVADMSWVTIKPNGMRVEIAGVAPDHLASARVLNKVGEAVNVDRIFNLVEVPEVKLEDTKTHIEIVQNEQVSSIVGLTPKEPSPVDLFHALDRAQPLVQTLNLVEDSVSTPTENWEDVLDFLKFTVGYLPRLRLTATPEEVVIDAIAKDEAEATQFRKALSDKAPASIKLVLNITAPRPLITPFEFKAEKTDDTTELVACSATNRVDVQRIQAAVAGLSAEAFRSCNLGLGAPTDHWGITVADIMQAVEKAPTYKVDIRDNQVKISLSDQIDDVAYDAIVTETRANLPPGFGLEDTRLVTIKSIEDLKDDGSEVKLVFTRDAEGKVDIRGVMGSGSSFDNLRGFAVAKFGTENVVVEPDIVEGLPAGWEQNAFTILEVISAMDLGEAVLAENQLLISGEIETQAILEGLEKILNTEVQEVTVSTDFNVKFKEAFSDTEASASACVEQLNSVLSESPIQFEAGSSHIAGVSSSVITKLGQIFYNCRNYGFEIGGHTDTSGVASANVILSQERADAILQALSELGIDFGPVTAKGYGSSEPVASNDTEVGRASNRRIEIRLMEEGESQ